MQDSGGGEGVWEWSHQSGGGRIVSLDLLAMLLLMQPWV